MNNISKIKPKYPWINFELNLAKLPWQTWIKLGECVAKCEQIKTIPLTPEVKQKLHTVYLAKGVHATTAIEGNTLSEQQVQDIVEKKIELPLSKQYLQKEVQNIIDACNIIGNEIIGNQTAAINNERLRSYNRSVLKDGVPFAEGTIPGEIRHHSVVVGNVYKAPDAKDVPELLDNFYQWINSNDFENNTMPIQFSILKAITAHLYIVWIHPFGDGNGRTARLVEFTILLQSGIPTPAAHLLSNHYNLTRAEYYRQLNKASKTRDITDLFTYAIQGFIDGLNEQLEYINKHVLDTCWREYVYETFNPKPQGITLKRRRKLALTISRQDKALTMDEIKLLMSREYANKSAKTLSRDLNEIIKMDLVVHTNNTYRAKKETMISFLPFSTNT
ncbi:MAG: Fic family protein [Sedimentisphaerales bacterium]|nr:Fic family protein [Sedimentisphaerales bacterium]